MSISKFCLRAAALAAAALVSVSAQAYSKLVVFGDSLSDNGNAHTLLSTYAGVNLPAAPYFDGRFTNGPVAVEVMASTLGLTMENYAFGGATTGVTNRIPGMDSIIQTGLQAQVNAYTNVLSTLGATADASALYVVWGGGNDFFSSATLATANTAIANLSNEVAQLYAAGAREFFVPLLPNLAWSAEAFEKGAAYQAGAGMLSAYFNGGLTSAMTKLEGTLAGANIQVFDTNQPLAAYRSALAAAGGNITDRCWTGNYLGAGAQCANPDQYFMWDGVHPTAGVHAYVGKAMAVAAVPEPETWGLLLAGVLVVGAMRRRQLLG